MGTPRFPRDCRRCDRVRILGCPLAQEGKKLPIDLVRRLGLQKVAVLAQGLPAYCGKHLTPRLQGVRPQGGGGACPPAGGAPGAGAKTRPVEFFQAPGPPPALTAPASCGKRHAHARRSASACGKWPSAAMIAVRSCHSSWRSSGSSGAAAPPMPAAARLAPTASTPAAQGPRWPPYACHPPPPAVPPAAAAAGAPAAHAALTFPPSARSKNRPLNARP